MWCGYNSKTIIDGNINEEEYDESVVWLEDSYHYYYYYYYYCKLKMDII